MAVMPGNTLPAPVCGRKAATAVAVRRHSMHTRKEPMMAQTHSEQSGGQ